MNERMKERQDGDEEVSKIAELRGPTNEGVKGDGIRITDMGEEPYGEKEEEEEKIGEEESGSVM